MAKKSTKKPKKQPGEITRGPGRPPRADGRMRAIFARVPAAEADKIERAARASGLSVSEYVRQKLTT